MTHYARASAWIGMPELIDELGGDSVEVLQRAGLSPQDLGQTDGFLPYDAFIATLNLAAEQTGRPDFAMLSAQRAGVRGLGMLGVAMSNAPSARASVELCSRYMRANSSASTIALTPLPGGTSELITLEHAYSVSVEMVQLFERVLAMMHFTSAASDPARYQALGVRFAHFRNAPMSDYVKVFGVEPSFNRSLMGIEVDRRYLDAPRASRSIELSQMSEAYLRTLVSAAELSITDTARRVARVLIEMGECSPVTLANAFGMHERTLQRRLKEAGSSFAIVRDEARRDLFEMLLAQDSRSLTNIAMVLGYSNSSTLSRNCQRWFGESPSNLRMRREAG